MFCFGFIKIVLAVIINTGLFKWGKSEVAGSVHRVRLLVFINIKCRNI